MGNMGVNPPIDFVNNNPAYIRRSNKFGIGVDREPAAAPAAPPPSAATPAPVSPPPPQAQPGPPARDQNQVTGGAGRLSGFL